jgi:hypothetical protein
MDESRLDPSLPAHPLWDGIYSFPWHPSNLKTLILLAFSLTVFAFAASCMHLLTDLLGSIPEWEKWSVGGEFVFAGAKYVFSGLCVLMILSSFYPAAVFLNVVIETAAGNDLVKWEDSIWWEWLSKWVLLLWLAGCSSAVAVGLLFSIGSFVPLDPLVWWAGMSMVSLIVFPLVVLCVLAGGAFWVLVHPDIFLGFFQKPHVGPVLYLNSFFFAIPCFLLGYWTVLASQWWLAPVTGFVSAIYWLVYARLLGRVGLVLAEGER